MLPYLLDIIRFEAGEALGVAVQSTFDGFGVAFERCLAPADVAFGVGDFDEEPLGRG